MPGPSPPAVVDVVSARTQAERAPAVAQTAVCLSLSWEHRQQGQSSGAQGPSVASAQVGAAAQQKQKAEQEQQDSGRPAGAAPRLWATQGPARQHVLTCSPHCARACLAGSLHRLASEHQQGTAQRRPGKPAATPHQCSGAGQTAVHLRAGETALRRETQEERRATREGDQPAGASRVRAGPPCYWPACACAGGCREHACMFPRRCSSMRPQHPHLPHPMPRQARGQLSQAHAQHAWQQGTTLDGGLADMRAASRTRGRTRARRRTIRPSTRRA